MITCDFRGELGNNLFQLAALIGHAERFGYDFCIPYHRDRPKNLEISSIFDYSYIYKNINVPEYRCRDMYAPELERSFGYQEIPKIDNISINGYFQSEKYFRHISDKLRCVYFKFQKKHTDYVSEKYGEVLSRNTVAIHIRDFRKGGYGTGIEEYHPFVPIEFYENLIRTLPSDLTYLIVSPDIVWCRDNLSFIKDPVFVDNGNIATDLLVLSKCKNVIIANSTYSWWGAWLSSYTYKKIYVPKSFWFGPALRHLDTKDLFPEEWILL